MSAPQDWLGAFMAEERLPDSFRQTFEEVCWPLADRAVDWRADFGRTALIGLCGAQGSGKSTIAAATARLLAERGFNVAAISLDDFYLGREARGWLAGKTHRLLQVRGPPGTHDVALACAVLDHLRQPGATPLPAFDKATDERRPKSRWREVEGPVDIVIFEGWCVGARPEPAERLRTPLNALERRDDPSGAWRGYVNRQLAEPYQALFGRLDRLVMLAAPGFEVVRGWRAEQEAKLRARTGAGMSDAQVGQFVQHYERLTRWMLEEMPRRADWTIRLNADRTPRPTGLATRGS
ncbi:kinase [Phenylobacterium sp.]|uniref:kinase n=1 Tax=Phenylobacterium sp. TaxID=1871053 RepID=UPI0025D5EFB0|nr:kinase [Phenylobacterium sp.]